jgi:hypothetical protein
VTENNCQTNVGVLDHPRIRGGCFTLEVSQLSIAEALTRRHESDAHCQPAYSPKRPHSRLVTSDIGRVPIVLGSRWFDIDLPGHRWDDGAWAEERSKIAAVSVAFPDSYVFTTRAGYRLIWLRATPYEITSSEDAARCKAEQAGACDVLETYGIRADRACLGPLHLYRLPWVIRDGQCTEPEIIGSADRIGFFELPEGSPKPKHSTSPAAASSRAALAGQDANSDAFAPTALLADLQRAGLVIGPGPLPGSLLIVCPRDAAHSTGRSGDGSTVYHAPNVFGGSGWLDCKHSGCRAACKTVRDWRRAVTKAIGVRGSFRSPLAADVVG